MSQKVGRGYPKELSGWETSDGQRFFNEAQAINHQEMLDQEEEINARYLKMIAAIKDIRCGSMDATLGKMLKHIATNYEEFK